MVKGLTRHKLYVFVGLAGVHEKESKKVRSIGHVFLYLIVLAALALLVEWQLELTNKLNATEIFIFNWAIWLVFVTEFSVLLYLVKDKKRFLSQNWLLPVIIVLGLPFILNYSTAVIFLRTLRPIFAIILMFPTLGMLGKFFADGRLLTTLFAAFIIVFFVGFLVAGVDPNIKTAWDGVWWALATVSTVGYGDVVPSSFLGRLIGAGLVILGLGIFVVITANFLAIILRKEVRGVKHEEFEVAEILREVTEIRETQKEIQQSLKFLNDRLDRQD